MMTRFFALVALVLLTACNGGDKPNSTSPTKSGGDANILKDYVKKPLDLAKDAREKTEQRYKEIEEQDL